MKISDIQIQQIKDQFTLIETKEDFVELLSKAKNILYGKECKPIKLKSLSYYADPRITKKRYNSFSIKKKSGADRTIHAPVRGLKSILRSLNFVLQCIYVPHDAATAFVMSRSIVDNAQKHINNNYVYNIDLKDFFYSFDRNRVKLGLMSEPFNLKGKKENLAFLISCLCTHPIEINGDLMTVLPQGSPTSPTLTNILCNNLDRRLTGLAKRFGLTYSRYADDITFSSPHNVYKNDDFLNELNRIIEIDQNLTINPDKTRLQKSQNRQEATGLIVNKKVNVNKIFVKQLRMWLYYWDKYGYNHAEEIFQRDYYAEKGHIKKQKGNLNNVVSGKLEFLKMVKSSDDSTYLKLSKKFNKLSIQNPTSQKASVNLENVVNTILNKSIDDGLKIYKSYKLQNYDG